MLGMINQLALQCYRHACFQHVLLILHVLPALPQFMLTGPSMVECHCNYQHVVISVIVPMELLEKNRYYYLCNKHYSIYIAFKIDSQKDFLIPLLALSKFMSNLLGGKYIAHITLSKKWLQFFKIKCRGTTWGLVFYKDTIYCKKSHQLQIFRESRSPSLRSQAEN